MKKSLSKYTIVGVDPANTGAAVVITDNVVTAVALWKPCQVNKKKGFKLQISYSGIVKELKVRTAAHIGHTFSNMPFLSVCNGLALEDCYVSRNPKTAISLARIGGSIAAPLEVKSGLPAYYVRANKWRSVVLGVGGRTKREQIKQIVLKEIPKIIPSIKVHLDSLGYHDHITDATGIALWLLSKRQ